MEESTQSAVGYRRRAAELRTVAEASGNPETKRAMLSIADNYEQLVSSIERIASKR